ncbi:NADPH-dependent FMN reductase [Sphingobacterium sp. FBM7-1]|uniref:NADPH-dependent FMN reductase n=1 Tax=Sphingobacterium sp. FBM7-1 TaxID=2886688 RepID=UPI001D0F5C28|nr:NAD(P)H-dependent oxidoreductase [Sphingobacterium sp. FBM7-1]MCC2600688.1 NAD(P)H-dependent oxidoreductase [Sphingobacterium sp. FBM7-1]
MRYKIAALVGSLRKDSFNRKVAENLIRLAPDNLEMEIVEIGQLAHYNEDLDTDNPPAEWSAFREKIKTYDGVFLFTPEYNRSLSGVLKNALDVGSRPYGQSVWDGKPAAVASVSMSPLAASIANHTVRQSLVFLNMPVMQQPEIYIGSAHELFDENGKVIEKSEGFFKQVVDAYAAWVEKNIG